MGLPPIETTEGSFFFLLDMLECVDVIITYPQADRHLCGYGHCVVQDILSRRHTACSPAGLIEPN